MNKATLSKTLAALQSMIARPAKPTSDTVIVGAGEIIPADGEIIDGCASVDESAIVGVSAPAILSNEPGRNMAIAGGVVIEGTLTIKLKRK